MFKTELNKTLTYLCLTDRLIIEINEQLSIVNSTSKNYELQSIVLYDFIYNFSPVIQNLIIDCAQYRLIDKLNWNLVDSNHEQLEKYIKEFLWTGKESSLNIVLGHLSSALIFLDSLYQFRNENKINLVTDNIIQVRVRLQFLIRLLINSKYCSNQAKFDVIALNLDPEITFDSNIFKNYPLSNKKDEINLIDYTNSVSTNLTNRSYSSLFLILVTIVLICFIPAF